MLLRAIKEQLGRRLLLRPGGTARSFGRLSPGRRSLDESQYADGRRQHLRSNSLSRCSSASSINNSSGIDMESPSPTPPVSLFRGLEKEQEFRTDAERLQNTRREMDHLQEERRSLEADRLEKEEHLWQVHEQHQEDIARQRRLLVSLEKEHEEQRTRAESELHEERRLFQEQRARLEQSLVMRSRHLEGVEDSASIARPVSCNFGVQTQPDLGDLALRTESQMSFALGPSREADVLSDREFFRLTLDEQRKWLIDQEASLRLERERMEERLKEREHSLEEMFLVGSEKIEVKKARLEASEREFKRREAEMYQELKEQGDVVDSIAHKEKQLMMYEQEKMKEMAPSFERSAPLGASFSEDSLPCSAHSTRFSSTGTIDAKGSSMDTLTSQVITRPKILTPSPKSKKKGSKFNTSQTAQQVTDRLYNINKIREKTSLKAGLKKNEISKTPPSSSCFGQSQMYTRSKSAPSLEDLQTTPKARKLRSSSPRLRLSSSSLASVPERLDETKQEVSLSQYMLTQSLPAKALKRQLKSSKSKVKSQTSSEEELSTISADATSVDMRRHSPDGLSMPEVKQMEPHKGSVSPIDDVTYSDNVEVFVAEQLKTDSAVKCSVVPESTKVDDQVKAQRTLELKPKKDEKHVEPTTRIKKKKKRKSGVKRTNSKLDGVKSDSPICKPKKKKERKKNEDIAVEIYLPTGGYGGAGASAFDIGGPGESGDALQLSKDPAHQLFAKSLRSGSIRDEDEVYFDEGAKIIKRARRPSADELQPKRSRIAEQSFVPRVLPDGRKQSIEYPEAIPIEVDRNSGDDRDPDSLNTEKALSDIELTPEMPFEEASSGLQKESISLTELQQSFGDVPETQASSGEETVYSDDSLDDGVSSVQCLSEDSKIVHSMEQCVNTSPLTNAHPKSPEHKTGSFVVVAPATTTSPRRNSGQKVDSMEGTPPLKRHSRKHRRRSDDMADAAQPDASELPVHSRRKRTKVKEGASSTVGRSEDSCSSDNASSIFTEDSLNDECGDFVTLSADDRQTFRICADEQTFDSGHPEQISPSSSFASRSPSRLLRQHALQTSPSWSPPSRNLHMTISRADWWSNMDDLTSQLTDNSRSESTPMSCSSSSAHRGLDFAQIEIWNSDFNDETVPSDHRGEMPRYDNTDTVESPRVQPRCSEEKLSEGDRIGAGNLLQMGSMDANIIEINVPDGSHSVEPQSDYVDYDESAQSSSEILFMRTAAESFVETADAMNRDPNLASEEDSAISDESLSEIDSIEELNTNQIEKPNLNPLSESEKINFWELEDDRLSVTEAVVDCDVLACTDIVDAERFGHAGDASLTKDSVDTDVTESFVIGLSVEEASVSSENNEISQTLMEATSKVPEAQLRLSTDAVIHTDSSEYLASHHEIPEADLMTEDPIAPSLHPILSQESVESGPNRFEIAEYSPTNSEATDAMQGSADDASQDSRQSSSHCNPSTGFVATESLDNYETAQESTRCMTASFEKIDTIPKFVEQIPVDLGTADIAPESRTISFENPEANSESAESRTISFVNPEANSESAESRTISFENPKANSESAESRTITLETPEANSESAESRTICFENPETNLESAESRTISFENPEANLESAESRTISFVNPEANSESAESRTISFVNPEANLESAESRTISFENPEANSESAESRTIIFENPEANSESGESRTISFENPEANSESAESRTISFVNPEANSESAESRTISFVNPEANLESAEARTISFVNPEANSESAESRTMSFVNPEANLESADARTISFVNPEANSESAEMSVSSSLSTLNIRQSLAASCENPDATSESTNTLVADVDGSTILDSRMVAGIVNPNIISESMRSPVAGADNLEALPAETMAMDMENQKPPPASTERSSAEVTGATTSGTIAEQISSESVPENGNEEEAREEERADWSEEEWSVLSVADADAVAEMEYDLDDDADPLKATTCESEGSALFEKAESFFTKALRSLGPNKAASGFKSSDQSTKDNWMVVTTAVSSGMIESCDDEEEQNRSDDSDEQKCQPVNFADKIATGDRSQPQEEEMSKYTALTTGHKSNRGNILSHLVPVEQAGFHPGLDITDAVHPEVLHAFHQDDDAVFASELTSMEDAKDETDNSDRESRKSCRDSGYYSMSISGVLSKIDLAFSESKDELEGTASDLTDPHSISMISSTNEEALLEGSLASTEAQSTGCNGTDQGPQEDSDVKVHITRRHNAEKGNRMVTQDAYSEVMTSLEEESMEIRSTEICEEPLLGGDLTEPLSPTVFEIMTSLDHNVLSTIPIGDNEAHSDVATNVSAPVGDLGPAKDPREERVNIDIGETVEREESDAGTLPNLSSELIDSKICNQHANEHATSALLDSDDVQGKADEEMNGFSQMPRASWLLESEETAGRHDADERTADAALTPENIIEKLKKSHDGIELCHDPPTAGENVVRTPSRRCRITETSNDEEGREEGEQSDTPWQQPVAPETTSHVRDIHLKKTKLLGDADGLDPRPLVWSSFTDQGQEASRTEQSTDRVEECESVIITRNLDSANVKPAFSEPDLPIDRQWPAHTSHDHPPRDVTPPDSPRGNMQKSVSISALDAEPLSARFSRNLSEGEPVGRSMSSVGSLGLSDLHLQPINSREDVSLVEDIAQPDAVDRGSFQIVHFKAPEPKEQKHQRCKPMSSSDLVQSETKFMADETIEEMAKDLEDNDHLYAVCRQSTLGLVQPPVCEESEYFRTESLDVNVSEDPGDLTEEELQDLIETHPESPSPVNVDSLTIVDEDDFSAMHEPCGDEELYIVDTGLLPSVREEEEESILRNPSLQRKHEEADSAIKETRISLEEKFRLVPQEESSTTIAPAKEQSSPEHIFVRESPESSTKVSSSNDACEQECLLDPDASAQNENSAPEIPAKHCTFVDSQSIGFDVKPGDMVSTPDELLPDRQDMILEAQSTIGYSATLDRVDMTNDMHVVGLQPASVNDRRAPPSDRILREDITSVVQQDLSHGGLNVEIQPWKMTNIPAEEAEKEAPFAESEDSAILSSEEEQKPTLEDYIKQKDAEEVRIMHAKEIKCTPRVVKAELVSTDVITYHRPDARASIAEQPPLTELTNEVLLEESMVMAKFVTSEDAPAAPLVVVPLVRHEPVQMKLEENSDGDAEEVHDPFLPSSSPGADLQHHHSSSETVDEDLIQPIDVTESAKDVVMPSDVEHRMRNLFDDLQQEREELGGDFIRNQAPSPLGSSEASSSMDEAGFEFLHTTIHPGLTESELQLLGCGGQLFDDLIPSYNELPGPSDADGRCLSPGELSQKSPLSIKLPLHSDSSLNDLVDQISHLPDLVSQSVVEARRGWSSSQCDAWGRSLSTSELEFTQTQDVPHHRSHSAECLQFVEDMGQKVQSDDSITYIFVSKGSPSEEGDYENDEPEPSQKERSASVDYSTRDVFVRRSNRSTSLVDTICKFDDLEAEELFGGQPDMQRRIQRLKEAAMAQLPLFATQKSCQTGPAETSDSLEDFNVDQHTRQQKEGSPMADVLDSIHRAKDILEAAGGPFEEMERSNASVSLQTGHSMEDLYIDQHTRQQKEGSPMADVLDSIHRAKDILESAGGPVEEIERSNASVSLQTGHSLEDIYIDQHTRQQKEGSPMADVLDSIHRAKGILEAAGGPVEEMERSNASVSLQTGHSLEDLYIDQHTRQQKEGSPMADVLDSIHRAKDILEAAGGPVEEMERSNANVSLQTGRSLEDLTCTDVSMNVGLQTGDSLNDILDSSIQTDPESERTIETQTYPQLRAIETQTDTDHSIIETETDQGRFVETGINPSPPKSASPVDFKELSQHSVGLQAGVLLSLSDLSSDDDEYILKTSTDSNASVPNYDFEDPGLAILREEHAKFMEAFHKAKEKREDRIVRRREIKHNRTSILDRLPDTHSDLSPSFVENISDPHPVLNESLFQSPLSTETAELSIPATEDNNAEGLDKLDENVIAMRIAAEMMQSNDDDLQEPLQRIEQVGDNEVAKRISAEMMITRDPHEPWCPNEEMRIDKEDGNDFLKMVTLWTNDMASRNLSDTDVGSEGLYDSDVMPNLDTNEVARRIAKDMCHVGNESVEDKLNRMMEVARKCNEVTERIAHAVEEGVEEDVEQQLNRMAQVATNEVAKRIAREMDQEVPCEETASLEFSAEDRLRQMEQIGTNEVAKRIAAAMMHPPGEEEGFAEVSNDAKYPNSVAGRIDQMSDAERLELERNVEQYIIPYHDGEDANRLNLSAIPRIAETGDEFQSYLERTPKSSSLLRLDDLRRPRSRHASTQYEDDVETAASPSQNTSTQCDESVTDRENFLEAQLIQNSLNKSLSPRDSDDPIKVIIEKYITIRNETDKKCGSGDVLLEVPEYRTRQPSSTTSQRAPSPTPSEMVDESIGTDFGPSEYDDELDRLRRERQRILDMLAKDMMPSKFQVEVAEAQLNYIIGQTDLLLDTIDEPHDWDTSVLSKMAMHPEEHLSSISRVYLTRYRQSLEQSRDDIDRRILDLERKRDTNHRNRRRQRKDFAQLRRDASKEAFRIERHREQTNFSTIKNIKAKDDKMEPLSASRAMTPKERADYLTELRRGIVHSTKLDERLSSSPLHGATRDLDSYHTYDVYSIASGISQPTPLHSDSRLSGRDSSIDLDSSLDEDTARLLGDYQRTRGDMQQEIYKARTTLQQRQPRSLAASSPRTPTNSPIVDRASYSSMDSKDILEGEIDSEIARLRRTHSALSSSRPSTSLTTRYSERYDSAYEPRYNTTLSPYRGLVDRRSPLTSSPLTSSPLTSSFSLTSSSSPRYERSASSSFASSPFADRNRSSAYDSTRPVKAYDIKSRLDRDKLSRNNISGFQGAYKL